MLLTTRTLVLDINIELRPKQFSFQVWANRLKEEYMGLIKWDFLELFIAAWFNSSGTSRTTRKQTMTGSDLSRTRRVQGGSESAGIITISWSTSSMWSSTSLWLTQWQVLRLLCQSWTGKQQRWKTKTFLPSQAGHLILFRCTEGARFALLTTSSLFGVETPLSLVSACWLQGHLS